MISDHKITESTDEISTKLFDYVSNLSSISKLLFDSQIDIDLDTGKYSLNACASHRGKPAGDYTQELARYTREDVYPEDSSSVRHSLSIENLLSAKPVPVSVKYRLYRKGQWVWVESTAFTSILNGHGHACIITKNINEVENIIQGFQNREHQLMRIGKQLYIMHLYVDILDDTYRLYVFNDAETSDIAHEGKYSENLDSLCHRILPSYRRRILKAISIEQLRKSLSENCSSNTYGFSIKTKGGVQHEVEMDVYFDYTDGKPFATISVRDVSEAKHQKEYIANAKTNQAKQEEIMALIGSNYLCAATVNIVDWTVSFIQKPEDLGTDIPDDSKFDDIKAIFISHSYPGDDIELLEKKFSRQHILEEIDRQGSYDVETRRMRNGVTQWTLWRLVRLPSDNETLLVRQQDITAKKEAEDAKREAEVERQANKSKTVFLANVSHEIRTPLNAILGYAELLLTGDKLPKDAYDDVWHISEAGKTLLEIVNNILDLSKVESGQFSIRNDLYETKKLVDELSSSLLTRIKDKPISFSTEGTESMPEYLYGDAVLVKQIIMNLLSNAAKYTNSGYITLRMSYDDGLLDAQVIDTGIGIRQEDVERIFAKFERLESNIDHSIEGTGLGLPLTKQLVEQMGGTISVSSKLGSGSTFSVSIPQDLGAAPNEAYVDATCITAPGLRVLLVDDNSVNLTVAERLLKRFELDVDCASSGEECLEMLTKFNYDCILMDHMMPGMDGVEAQKRIRKMPGHEKQLVIALTANAMKGMHEFFLENGFDDYMPKPITLEAIASKIHKWAPLDRIVTREHEETHTEEYPEALSLCTGIDIDAAMLYTGSYSDLLSIINDFTGLIDMKSNQIECYARDGDIGSYTIEVHALKSSSRLIGALKLSELAAKLEQYGHEQNLDEIRSITPDLLELYRSYKEHLKPVADTMNIEGPKHEISNDELIESLQKLRAMLVDFDLDGAEVWSEEASKYKLDESTDTKMQSIRTSIQMIDYLGAIKQVDDTIEGLS